MKSASLCIALVGCAALFSSCSKLPEKRPADLRIYVSESGGMNPEGHSIALGKDSCTGDYYGLNATHHVRFAMTPAEWDSLYAVFKNEKFDLIGQHEEMIYDRGGSSLTLSFGDQNFNKSDGGMSVINGRWQSAYDSCIRAVYAIINRKVEPLKNDVRIILDSSLFAGKGKVSVQTGMSGYYFSPDNLHAGDTLKMRLFEGDYKFFVRIEYPSSYAGTLPHPIDANETFHVSRALPLPYVLSLQDSTVKLTLPPSAFYMDETESTH